MRGALILAAIAPLVIAIMTAISLGDSSYTSLSRGYPGQFTAVTAIGIRTVTDLASIVTLGSFVYLVFIRSRAGKTRLSVATAFELRIAQISSLVWMIGAALSALFDAADANGVAFTRIFEPGAFAYLVSAAYLPKAWIVTFVCTVIIFFGSYLARHWQGLLIPLGLSALGTLAPVIVGQVQVGPNHDLGTDSAVFNTLATAGLLGLVAVLAVRLASGRGISAHAVQRTGIVALLAVPVALASELVIAWFKTVGFSQWATPTGALISVRIAVIVLIAAVGAVLWMRRGRLSAGTTVTPAVAAVILSGAWVAASVMMTRIPPPQYFVPTSITEVFLGFDVSETPTLAVLLGGWRINILFAVIAVAAVTVYLLAVRRLRMRGDAWPLGRTVAWVAGWVVIFLATSSGVGKYSAASFSLHMIVHMSLNMLGPLLLVLGGVVTLLLRATKPAGRGRPAGPHEWLTAVLHWPVLRVIYNPLLVFVFFIGSYYGLYLTGLFGEAMRFHWAHQFMNLHFIIIGYLFYGIVVGVDRPPRPLPHLGKLGFVLAAMPFHAFFGVIVMTSTEVIAKNFYEYLSLPWHTDLLADQYVGGGIAWAAGEPPLILVVVALAIQWSRADSREAKRKDRHMDSGLDEDFDAYNKMLQQLQQRTPRNSGPRL